VNDYSPGRAGEGSIAMAIVAGDDGDLRGHVKFPLDSDRPRLSCLSTIPHEMKMGSCEGRGGGIR